RAGVNDTGGGRAPQRLSSARESPRHDAEFSMAKGMDKKKETKKKPSKTVKEKRAAKAAKKSGK
ncbi:MAG: hypothetical protein ACKO4A_07365, partial [Gammaproteobacteria bacterium]